MTNIADLLVAMDDRDAYCASAEPTYARGEEPFFAAVADNVEDAMEAMPDAFACGI